MPSLPPNITDKFRSIWKNTAARTAIIVATIAAFATLLKNLQTIKEFFAPKGVEMVDISFSHDTLDFKLRNTGTDVSLLKRVELVIKNKWLIQSEDPSKGFLLPSSQIYDISIDSGIQVHETVSKILSEEIKGNDAEHFVLVIGSIQKQLLGNYIYCVGLKIFYNKDNSLTASSNVLFAFLNHEVIVSPVADSLVHARNLLKMAEISAIDGIRSEQLQNLINLFDKNQTSIK